MTSDEMKLILKTNQLIIRDRRWQHEDNYEKSKVIDEQITELLNPKEDNKFTDQTKQALSNAKRT